MRTVKLLPPTGGGPVSITDFEARATLLRVFYAAQGVSPHSETVRVSATIPSGRRGVIRYGLLYATRWTTPSTTGSVVVKATVGTEDAPGMVYVFSGTVAAYDRLIMPAGYILEEGDTLEATTFDNSTGGSMAYRISFNIAHVDKE
jgi:hypothetical protein